MNRILKLVFAAVFGASFLGPPVAYAQSWPQRPITILIQTPPGTLLDVLGRSMGADITEALGQSVVFENRVGGGGSVMMKAASSTEPNGYTLAITAVGPAVIRTLMEPPVGYDFDRDFTPIVMIGDFPNTLLVSPKLGINTVQELVAYAKQHPNVTMAHSGPGTVGHLAAIMLGERADIKLNLISYRGSGPIITDLISGEIAAGFPPYNPAAKNVKIIAVASEKRLEFLPDVPTMAESGFPKFFATTWLALIGPANLPPDIVERLNAIINAWASKPGQRAHFNNLGFNLHGGTPADVTRQAEEDRPKWAAILRDHKITDAPPAR